MFWFFKMGATSSMPKVPLSKASEVILKEVREHPVVVYSKDHCPWCDRAKNKLTEDGIAFEEKNIVEIARRQPDGGQQYVQGLMDLTKQKTVPQVFICGKFIGGYTEMSAKRQDLRKLVEQCSVDGRTWDQKTVRPSSKI